MARLYNGRLDSGDRIGNHASGERAIPWSTSSAWAWTCTAATAPRPPAARCRTPSATRACRSSRTSARAEADMLVDVTVGVPGAGHGRRRACPQRAAARRGDRARRWPGGLRAPTGDALLACAVDHGAGQYPDRAKSMSTSAMIDGGIGLKRPAAPRALGLGRGAQRALLRRRPGLRGRRRGIRARPSSASPAAPDDHQPGPLRAGGRGAAARARGPHVPLRLGGGRADGPRARAAPSWWRRAPLVGQSDHGVSLSLYAKDPGRARVRDLLDGAGRPARSHRALDLMGELSRRGIAVPTS